MAGSASGCGINNRLYEVAGHLFELDYPKDILSEKELQPYAPFRTDCFSGIDRLFTLTLSEDAGAFTPNGQAIADFEDENGRLTLFSRRDEGMMIVFTTPHGRECGCLRIAKDYRTAEAWIGGSNGERCYAVDTALMMLYTFASSMRDTLLLHASAVEHDGYGYLFLGKSGTGKSTHSALWAKHIDGAVLLNDDNPVVRIIDGSVYVYGTPWSGKTSCYRNRRLPLKGIARLYQAPHNDIIRLSGIQAYAAIMPSCSCLKWDHEMAEAVHATLCRLIGKVAVHRLGCLPDRESAELCFNILNATDGQTSCC